MKIVLSLLCAGMAFSLVGCSAYGNDEGERYLQRKDSVTLSAGDAKEVNARTHMLAAWPPGVGDRRIPMEGARAAKAIECYKTGRRPQQASASGGAQVQLTLNTGSGSAQSQGAAQGSNCP